jgi:hypothetical protein
LIGIKEPPYRAEDSGVEKPNPPIEANGLDAVVESLPTTRVPRVETGVWSSGSQGRHRSHRGISGSGRAWIILMLCGFGIYFSSIAAFSSPIGILLGLVCILSGTIAYLCHGFGSIQDQKLNTQNPDAAPPSAVEKAALRPSLSEPEVCTAGGDVPVIDEGAAATATSHSEEEHGPSPVALPT